MYPVGYAESALEVREYIHNNNHRLILGNFGDCKSVGAGVSELRIDFGSGYRVYFARDRSTIVLLLCGGDKSTQPADIKRAKRYWKIYQSDKPGAGP